MKAEVKIAKRSSPVTLLILLFLLFGLLNVSPTLAHYEHYGYSHESDIGIIQDEWMKKLSNETYLYQLSIPGTHETMALHGLEDWSKCQSAPLSNQLKAGIRALDIRIRHFRTEDGEDIFRIYHSGTFEKANFTDVLKDCADLLHDHPSETILMRLSTNGCNHPRSEDPDYDYPQRLFNETFIDHLSQTAPDGKKYIDYIWRNESWWGKKKTDLNFTQPEKPKLGEVRGKIVILQQDAGVCNDCGKNTVDWHSEWGDRYYGLIWGDNRWFGYIQDKWDMTDDSTYWPYWPWQRNFNLVEKWNFVKQYFNDDISKVANKEKIMVNHLSASGAWSQPYFVASGHKWAHTKSGHWKWETFAFPSTFGGGKGGILDDFPRERGFFGIELVVLEGTNEMTYKYLRGKLGKVPQRSGIVMADFPGDALIMSIINLNSKYVEAYGVAIAPPVLISTSLEVEPGDTATFNVTLRNDGTANDTYNLRLNEIDPSWYNFSEHPVTLAKGTMKNVILNVTPTRHWSTAPGVYDFTITATSINDPEATDSSYGTITVLPFHETELFVVPDSFGAQPGDTVTYTIGVQNLGNVRDDYNVAADFVNPGGLSIDPRWTTLWPYVFWGLDPGNTGTGYLEISVPEDWAANGLEEATYNFTVYTECQANSTANDTVERTLNVMVGPRTLSITLSGEFDYTFKEPVTIKILALVKDIKCRLPISNANVTIEIHAPNGDLLWADQMVENGTGVYIWESEETIQDIMEGPHWQPFKGVYTVSVEASYNAGPISYETLEFHIDPPALSASISWVCYLVAAISTVLVGLFVIHKIRKKKTRIT